ncbi:uncharacterized protein LOC128034059 [Gossypium raimondii]|uniref:uncharacterized protein LOC128034059 n=1 Tax=Gossypium raimondii TaxID=29730 RepID=UPI00227A3C34|nr:uncharacterized protein LOC128034059 [Gossypium raimondii]
MAPYKALYGRRCRTPSCWTDLGERHILGPELVSDIEDKVRLIQDQLKAASDRQKSYVDLKRKEIEYFVGDFVFLKVSPWKKIDVRPDLTFDEEPVQILDRDVKILRKKSIPLVKVLWRNHSSEKATWNLKRQCDNSTLICFDQVDYEFDDNSSWDKKCEMSALYDDEVYEDGFYEE